MGAPRPARGRCAFAALLAGAIASPACQPSDDERPALPPDVVWIVLDSAGAKHLSFLDEDRPTTPAIDALAADPRSRAFRRAYCQWPSTLGSTASFLTGLYPPRDRRPATLASPTIAETLLAEGWRTAAFSENPWVSKDFGFQNGFELFVAGQLRDPKLGTFESGRYTGLTVGRALDWLGSSGERPSFVYVHLLPPHAPYAAPPPYEGRFSEPNHAGSHDGSVAPLLDVFYGRAEIAEGDLRHVRDLYQESLSFVDSQVGRMVDWLRSEGRLDRTLLIVTADHGEAFGEHGDILHGTSLYDEQIRVPLVVRFPDGVEITRRSQDDPVELIDVVPTIFDVVGLPTDGLPGHSLRLEAGSDGIARAWVVDATRRMSARIEGPHKRIVATDGSLLEIDLEADPSETSPRSRPETAPIPPDEIPEDHWLSWKSAPIDPRITRQLEALGYVEESPQ